jgi:cysteine-rich repeat protein
MLIVGCHEESSVSARAGAVFVYVRDEAGGWALQQVLRPAADGLIDAGQTNFGSTVGLDGNWLAVGTPSMPVAPEPDRISGQVYLYERRNGAWELAQQVRAQPEEVDNLGFSMAMKDGRLAVGRLQPFDVLLYELNDGEWRHTRTLAQDSEIVSSTRYGWSMAFADRSLLVGHPGGTRIGPVPGGISDFRVQAQCFETGECACLDGAAGLECSERPFCGDGLLQAAEGCDDGNQVNGDGCNAQCLPE